MLLSTVVVQRINLIGLLMVGNNAKNNYFSMHVQWFGLKPTN